MDLDCIIIDDEISARLILSQLCSEIEDISVVKEFENAVEAIKFLHKQQVDLVLLDVHLPDFTGFEFINTIKNPPKIILTTSDRNLASEAYEYDCIVDYLVKPISMPRFIKAVQKVKRAISAENDSGFSEDVIEESENQIYINIDRRLVKIDIPSIYLVEAKGDYIHLKTESGNFIVHSSLKKIQNKLPKNLFLRVHRSFLINIKKIIDIEENTVNINKMIIPISRSSRVELMRRINLL